MTDPPISLNINKQTLLSCFFSLLPTFSPSLQAELADSDPDLLAAAACYDSDAACYDSDVLPERDGRRRKEREAGAANGRKTPWDQGGGHSAPQAACHLQPAGIGQNAAAANTPLMKAAAAEAALAAKCGAPGPPQENMPSSGLSLAECIYMYDCMYKLLLLLYAYTCMIVCVYCYSCCMHMRV